jgi:cytochrome c oxidase subunit 3
VIPFSTLLVLQVLKWDGDFVGLFHLPMGGLNPSPEHQSRLHLAGQVALMVGFIGLLFTLMGWAHQVIKEKPLSHDLAQAQKDLKFFTLCFLTGELAIFGAIFAYFYHRKIWDTTGEFGAPHSLHFGGPVVAYATFMLISSSVTCEIAHQMVEHGKRGWAKFWLLLTIGLGTVFLGFQGKEYGELIVRGFTPGHLSDGHSAFASLFFTATGFHGLHVAIGLIMLFMVLLRLEAGHFQGRRHFSMVAASWYWHFVDIVWVLLFITVYVVG